MRTLSRIGHLAWQGSPSRMGDLGPHTWPVCHAKTITNLFSFHNGCIHLRHAIGQRSTNRYFGMDQRSRDQQSRYRGHSSHSTKPTSQ